MENRMKGLFQTIFFCGAVAFAGCTSTSMFSYDEDEIFESKEFRWNIDSLPSEAQLFFTNAETNQSLGATPGQVTFLFEKKPVQNWTRLFGIKEWTVSKSRKKSSFIRRNGEFFEIHIPELILKKEGYEPETFSGTWRIPSLMELRKNMWVTKELPKERNSLVVFRKPTKPQIYRKIVIELNSGTAQIFPLESRGSETSQSHGETPREFVIGAAPVRNKSGDIVNWRLWNKNKTEGALFSCNREGTIFFNGSLMRKDYAPEPVRQYPVLSLTEDSSEVVTVRFSLTQPQAPQVEFKLNVDSLPSGAEVYIQRNDGTLGQKMGQTPFEIQIGLAETLQKKGNEYQHKDWLIWAPPGLFQSEMLPNEITELYLTCALYKENYAVEAIHQSVFKLRPGQPLPKRKVLTFPLLSPELAAARESRSSQSSARSGRMDEHQPRQKFIWQAPSPDSSPSEEEKGSSSQKEENKRWWQRLDPF